MDIIEYDGIVFKRNPASKWDWNRRYFLGWRDRKQISLHRYKWEKFRGKIPKGHIVHHKDEDPGNNDIDNLECLTPSEHSKRHMVGDRVRDFIALASEWHGSEEGRRWHSEQAKRNPRPPITRTCDECGISYQYRPPTRAKFCSPKCAQRLRRRAGTDSETRTCQECGGDFECNRYYKTRTCSHACGHQLAWKLRRGVQPDG